MLTITLPDGQQVNVNISVLGGKAKTHVAHRPIAGAAWSPLVGNALAPSAGWDRVEAAILELSRYQSGR